MTPQLKLVPPAARTLDALAIAPGDHGAYQWWYFDALSEDGRFGLVAIYFVGGVFSAHYADRLADGQAASPFEHPMVNLALYDRARRVSWVFSEYPQQELVIERPDLDLRIAGSRVQRDEAGSYTLTVDDDDFPAGRRVELSARFRPIAPALELNAPGLDDRGRHFWGAAAPACEVQVECPTLGWRWSGHGYHDVNHGLEPLHAGFRHWSWGRANIEGRTQLFYDAVDIEGRRRRRIHSDGIWLGEDGDDSLETSLSPWLLRVPTRWRAPGLRVDEQRRWESSPFYTRGVSTFESPSGRAEGVSEHVDLQRFASPFVRWMLRYRIYRRPGQGAPPLPVHATWRDVLDRQDRLR